jgi:lipopolysaccharide/colanic/teichoic acid biosynthesis glycosyltransferase
MLLLALSPLIVLISFIQLFVFKRVLFTQKRIGLEGTSFIIYKFLTISPNIDKNLPLRYQSNKWGAILRKTSFDEIPQLLNVLLGEMNFIGPRPLLPEYLQFYTKRQGQRHNVKPGLTGWAQVNGRTSLSWEEQFELDVWYAENKSMNLDIKIIFLTLFRVLLFKREIKTERKPFGGEN